MRTTCIAMLWVAACGGGEGGSTVAGTLDRNTEVFCMRAHECRAQFPTNTGINFEDLFQATEPECETVILDASNVDEVQASVDAGRIIFRPGDAADCIGFFEGLNCTDFWGAFFDQTPARPSTCDTGFEGVVPAGGACTIGQDCAAMAGCDETTMTCG